MTLETQVIQVEQRVAAPPGAVYRHLTESNLVSCSIGESADLDPRPGGRYVVRMAEGQVVEGAFLAVEPGVRVVISWGWQGHPGVPPGTSTVEFELVPDGPDTIVRLTHRGLPVDEVPIHRQGWRVFLPRLATAASGEDPGLLPRPA